MQTISTHSLTKRLTPGRNRAGDSALISTHSLTKRLTQCGLHLQLLLFYFNSQPHEEADPIRTDTRHLQIYFNSQPHEEADDACTLLSAVWVIFQLTASRRGWRSLWRNTRTREHFNSQPHEEADGWKEDQVCVCHISTHSLTKRLT